MVPALCPANKQSKPWRLLGDAVDPRHIGMGNLITDFFRRFGPQPSAVSYPETPDTAPPASDAFALAESLGRGVTATDVAFALVAAGEGQPREQALVFQELPERDAMIGAHLGTRVNAVLACGWDVTSKQRPEVAAAIKKSLEALGMRHLMGHLLQAVPYGYSGAVLDWLPGGKDVVGWKPAMPWAWQFDLCGNAALTDLQGIPHSLTEWHPAQIITAYAPGMGLAPRRGLLRPLAWLYLLKQINFKNWGRFVEKFGIPVAILQAASGGDKAAAEVIKQVRKAGANAAVFTGPEAKVTFSGADSGSAAAFAELIGYIDRCIATLILGQTATSGDAKGFSNGGAQSAVRDDIRGADAMMLIEAVQKHIVVPMSLFRFGLQDPGDLRFWISYEKGGDEKSKAETWKILGEMTGRTIDADQASDEFGVRFGDPIATKATAAPPPLHDALALADAGKPPRAAAALEAIVAEAMRRTVEDERTAAEWLGPVRRAVHEAFGDIDPDAEDAMGEFRRRLPALMARIPGLYAEMDSAKFERHLAGAMLAGAVNGYLGPRLTRKGKA